MGKTIPMIMLALILGVGMKETLEERVAKLETRVTKIEESLSTGEQVTAGEATPSTPVPVPNSVVKVGRVYHAAELDLTLVSARIQTIRVRDMFDELKESNNPGLLLSFKLRNTTERKILRYTSNMFLGSKIGVVDDVQNFIRGVNYGFGNRIVGEMKDPTDIDPGAIVQHAAVFSTPPPKTKHIIVTVDLAMFGSTGTAKFIVTAAEMGLK